MIQLLAFFMNAWVIVGVLFLLGIIAGIAALFVYVIIALYHIVRKHINDFIQDHLPKDPPEPCECEDDYSPFVWEACNTPLCQDIRKAMLEERAEARRILAEGPLLPPKDGRREWVVSWRASDRYTRPEVEGYDPNDGGVHA